MGKSRKELANISQMLRRNWREPPKKVLSKKYLTQQELEKGRTYDVLLKEGEINRGEKSEMLRESQKDGRGATANTWNSTLGRRWTAREKTG